ncbi:hypothetical protein JA1_000618 [Spathaspora sp. JA1]|nr:hypothetical protein JA1_000618 [Spathaspora sp. JA1]
MANHSISEPAQFPHGATGFVGARSSFSAGSGISTGSVFSTVSSSIWNDVGDSSSTLIGNSFLDDSVNDYLFSPFWKEQQDEATEEEDEGKKKEIYQRSKDEEVELEKSIKYSNKQNIYSSKVNNPTFIPSTMPFNSTDSLQSTSTEDTSYLAPKLTVEKATSADVRPGNRIQQKVKQEKQVISRESIKAKLPSVVRNTPRSDYFVRNIMHSQQEKRYSEDYCSTFYKRNRQGYMFIKEPSNSLKVHTSGGKSWINLKISLPDQNNNLLSRKLKVDATELPVWRPITIGGGSSVSFTGRRRGQRRKP